MGELYVVRHGRAHRPLESDFGASYSLTPEGRSHVLETGEALHGVISSSEVEGIECVPTLRSRDTAKLLAGALKISTAISEQPVLQHRGYEVPELVSRLEKWAYDKKAGIYVCAMSRRAILGLMAPALGLTPNDINNTEDESDIVIPCASVTRLTVSETGLKIVKIGMSPDELVA